MAPEVQPRAIGEIKLASKLRDGRSVLADLRMSGALKVLFPQATDTLQAIMINTSGGITGGDQFGISAEIGEATRVSLTTQAAERAYCANPSETGHMRTRISVKARGCLHWLPQELILYDGCALERRLNIDLEETAELLMVEPVVFGRTAMGERLTQGLFRDRIEITRANRPLYLDGVSLRGDIAAQLEAPAIAGGAMAVASVLYVAPDAARFLQAVRAYLPVTGGAVPRQLRVATALAARA